MAGRGWGRLSASTSGRWVTEGQFAESTFPEVRATLLSLDEECHCHLGRDLWTDHPSRPHPALHADRMQ